MKRSLTKFFIGWALLSFAGTAYPATSYNIGSGATTTVDEYSVCRMVTNNNAKAMMVATNSSAAWVNFRAHVPANVSVNTCTTCPAGYVLVPGDATYSTADFCVMQYEAKNVGGIATSQSALTPWVSMNYANTLAKCTALGANYNLISNTEWQTIVTNLEYVNANWTGGSRGVGMLKMGNIGKATNGGYIGSCPEAGVTNAKATQTLSNGNTIHHIGGNVNEWILADSYTRSPSVFFYGAQGSPLLAGADRIKFGPKGTYTSGCGAGDNSVGAQCGVGGYTLVTQTAWFRGGACDDNGSDSFTAYLQYGAATVSSTVGFRCVYHPSTSSPTFVQETETTWNTNTSPRTTASFNVQAGDILVAYASAENSGVTMGISGGSLTWTLRQTTHVSIDLNVPEVNVWTALADADKSMTVSFTGAGGGNFGGNVLTFRGSSGVGASAVVAVATGAPTLNLTTTKANSAIVVVNSDWNAVSGASRTYRTGAGAFSETTYSYIASNYTAYGGYHPNAGAIGTYAVGLSAPTGQKYGLIAIEIKGP